MDWNGKPYHSLDYDMKKQFGTKVYKIALDGGMTCPNRDGTLGSRGCLFCSAGGSGEFAEPFGEGILRGGKAFCLSADEIAASVNRQIELGAKRIEAKLSGSASFIAYFQSYTNTYGPLSYLEALFSAAIRHPKVKILSIATRPDCLSDDVLDLCARFNAIKPVWLELGLQSIHQDTACLIRRGYDLSVFEDALIRLRKRNLETIIHVILGLPGEDRNRMLQTVSYLAHKDIQGIKLQLLHVLSGTDLAVLYEKTPFPILTMEEYADLIIDCVSLLPPEMTVHRLTGDGPRKLLIAPLWSTDKKRVLNTLNRRFKERGAWQGCEWKRS